MIPDSHAHLDLLEEDTAEALSAARSAGVSPVVTIGINIESSVEAARLAGSCDGVFASVGIHPNNTAGVGGEAFERLEEVARSCDRVVAIGETGLDFYRDRSPADLQVRSLRMHVRLARRLEKALVVHDRQAHRELLEVLADERAGDFPLIMHCFSADEEVLRECSRRGYYISFAGPLTFRNNHVGRRLAELAPMERLLVETDAPFLSPEPFRGKPNSPARARLVAETLARVRGVTLDEMGRVLEENTARAFSIQTAGG